jgi:hypothetical protein
MGTTTFVSRTRRAIVIAAVIGATVMAGNTRTQAQASFSRSYFAVEFSDCVESIGVTLAATAGVRPYVPSPFVVVGEGQPVTPLVVRTARCGIAIDGGRARRGEIVQVGAVIVPPDFTGDINNYTIWYYTSDAYLALRLILAGVHAQFVPTIDYDYHPVDSAFHVAVPLPGIPRLELSGMVTESPLPAGSFLANWWQLTPKGMVKMGTDVPVIDIGGADLTLTTRAQGPLGQLIGGSAIGFPILQQFNTFVAAQMSVVTQ